MHTLNELTAVLAANYTESEFCEAIANLTGWEYDAENRKIYLSSTHKIFFEFEDASSTGQLSFTPHFTSDITGGAVPMVSATASISYPAKFWCHKSADESITYFGFRADSSTSSNYPYREFIIANDMNDNEALLYYRHGSDFSIGVKELSEPVAYEGVSNSYRSNQKYFLTKFVNPWSGVEFKELYLIMNSQACILTNHLVRFDNGRIMRLVHRTHTSSYQSGFAFPVSEG